MALAHRRGISGVVRAYRSQIHPVFMLPALTASLFGAVLAESVTVSLALFHAVVVCAQLYTAHLKDGYVDRYLRQEDDHNPLTPRGCRVGLLGSSLVVAVTSGLLAVLVDPFVIVLLLPGWVVAYFHAPQFDTHPLSATGGYPFGIGISLCGGYYVQTTTLATPVLVYALVIGIVLVGIKLIDDCTDVEYDRSIQKRTAAVVLGIRQTRQLGTAVLALGMVVLAVSGHVRVIPIESLLAIVVFTPIVLVARHRSVAVATMLLIRGTYLFFAVLLVTAWQFG
ncbi:UbiA family prenyltransferase [Halocatena halophila]|uniref:UbiA family prenyltransferase n=1 Tax=Halocatena halophila TaxID=2814576 RepID=UPI002ED1ABC9